MLFMLPQRDVKRYVQTLISKNPVIIDTETTGLSNKDVIVEIAVVGMDGTVLVDTLVRPSRDVSPGALVVHGIGEEELVDAPTFDIIWQGSLQDIFARRIICAYNVDFDIRMIKQSLRVYGMSFPRSTKTECIMKLFAELNGEWDSARNHFKWVNLKRAADMVGVSVDKKLHRALADAMLAREVLLKMGESGV